MVTIDCIHTRLGEHLLGGGDEARSSDVLERGGRAMR